jgi:acyl carrier protein
MDATGNTSGFETCCLGFLWEALGEEASKHETVESVDADSLLLIEWVFTIEEEYRFRAPDDLLRDVTGSTTIGEIVAQLEQVWTKDAQC